MRNDARGELRGVGIRDRRAVRVGVAGNEPRDERVAIGAIQEQHALAGSVRAPQDVPDFEPDTEAGSGSICDEHVAGIQPRDIAVVDFALGQARFGSLDVVSEQVRGEKLVAGGLERARERAQPGDGAAIAPDGACQIDFQTQDYLEEVAGVSTGALAARRPFSQSWMISM